MYAFDVVTINRLCSAALPNAKKTALVVIANSSAGRRSGGVMQEAKDGYVRCGIIHMGEHPKFDAVNETPQAKVLTVVVEEGPLHIALSRTAAEFLQKKRELFIKDWPECTE